MFRKDINHFQKKVLSGKSVEEIADNFSRDLKRGLLVAGVVIGLMNMIAVIVAVMMSK